jgi:cell wall assembly regulator SMI1/ankyrin repeat protein
MANDINALVLAVSAGDTAKVMELIAAGVSVNQQNGSGNLPLTDAAQRGRTELVKLLLQAGANVNGATKSKRSALMWAAEGGHVDVVETLLAAKADVNQEGKNVTPLAAAVSDGTKAHLQIVEKLLAAGADVNYGKFSTVLMRASQNSSAEILKVLLDAGAHVNTVTRLGSALTMAIQENRPENAVILLQRGADAHVRFPADTDEAIAGKTPLEYAAAAKATKILALLEGAKKASSKAAPATPAELWQRIESALQRKSKKEMLAGLNAGASPQELSQLERTVGKELLDDFKAAYGIHNGQRGGGDLVPPLAKNEEGYFLIPIKSIASEWKSWKDLTVRGEFKAKESSPETGIQGVWWHPGWIPFASNGAGDSISLDLAPAVGGTIGQVITMGHEISRRQLLAPSFIAWFTELAQMIEQG